MKKITLTLALCAIHAFINAQEKNKIVKISGIGFQTGFENNNYGFHQNFNPKSIAPTNPLTQVDLSQYNDDNYSFGSGSTLFSYFMDLSIGQKMHAKPNQKFRLGLTYQSSTIRYLDQYSFETSAPYDTLISTKTGQSTQIDTTFSRYYNYSIYSDQLRVDLGYLFSSSSDYRFSVYTGFLFSIGRSINTFFDAYTYSSSSIDEGNSNSPNYNNGSDQARTPLKEMIFSNLNIPIGMNYRIGQKNEFLKHINIFSEFKPGFTLYKFNVIPSTRINFNWILTFGLKYQL